MVKREVDFNIVIIKILVSFMEFRGYDVFLVVF